ncbi:MAG: RNA polymerase sigma factor [Oscillospiraceae bacterium]
MEKDMKDLLLKAQSGDCDAFGEIYSLYAKQLYLYALKYLGNTYDAEDAVSECVIKVFKSVKSIKSPEKVKAYFFKALSNTAKTMLSQNSLKLVDELDENVKSEECLEDSMLLSYDIQNALKTISEEEKTIVLLSAVGGFNSKEISKIIDVPAVTVRSKLSRAFLKLRKEIEK